jgi:hypothetical protein
VTWVKWKFALVRLEMVLISVKNRSTVCAECTTGMEIFWPHVMDPLGDVGEMKAHFGPFGDSGSLHTGLVHG